MRLEPFGQFALRYVEGTWVVPFGGAESAGFGWGEGTISGDGLEGTVRWANYPRRREDGVWTPNLRGVINSADGAQIVMSMHGQSVEESRPSGECRAILLRLELLSDHESYRWLNTTFIVGEGEIDEETEEIVVRTYVCVNELVDHAPAIGDAPPEQFRQGE